ncbi:hypothetical protein B0T16DRAFT_455530 [Cercophora newfieldiana]|uniref:Uncharacterized protein n=1 Tax=Cercophora newfieldiana TaxID=92897 RepID=A0AA39Y968_9PEZI|nr:hypothetical protein B0T16DRAFT_455530 [Cercophora newfieldiana]
MGVVTQETVKPSEHEIIEEHVDREIHTHEVRPQIQSIIDREVLPARHYVQDDNGKLVEVAEEDLPKYIGPVGTTGSEASPAKVKAEEHEVRKTVLDSSRTVTDLPADAVPVEHERDGVRNRLGLWASE